MELRQPAKEESVAFVATTHQPGGGNVYGMTIAIPNVMLTGQVTSVRPELMPQKLNFATDSFNSCGGQIIKILRASIIKSTQNVSKK